MQVLALVNRYAKVKDKVTEVGEATAAAAKPERSARAEAAAAAKHAEEQAAAEKLRLEAEAAAEAVRKEAEEREAGNPVNPTQPFVWWLLSGEGRNGDDGGSQGVVDTS